MQSYEVSIGAQPGNTQLRTVCYQRTPTHSKAWMFTQAPAAVRQGVTIPTAFYTDLMIPGYRMKYTAGRNSAGIAIDNTFCTCAPIVQGGKTVDFVKALTNEYCEGMGAHSSYSNTVPFPCRVGVPQVVRGHRAHCWAWRRAGEPVPKPGSNCSREQCIPAAVRRPPPDPRKRVRARFAAHLISR